MEVKVGYKQSELGPLPNEWSVKRLGELGQVVRGGSPRPAGDPRFFDGNYIPWLTVAALTNISEHSMEVTSTIGFLTEEGSKRSRILPNNTLIIANSGATLGVAKLLKVTSCANDGIAAIIRQHSGHKPFICHYINTQTRTLREVIATGNGQPNLNTALIREIPIPFPPLPEQHVIANALSDVDQLITSLDQLITKKRDLKKAAMQQLLTGKTRLQGFSGEWKPKRLGDVCQIAMGRTPSRINQSYWGKGHPWLSIADIKEKYTFNSSEEITEQGAAIMAVVPKGTLLMTFKLSIGRLTFSARDIYTNEAICSFQQLSEDGEYLYYALAMVEFSLYGKQAVKGYTLNKQSLKSILVSFPSISEQRAIAEVLSDMDADLAELEQRRDKTIALKHGMMQELLTGRTRLV